MRHVFHIDVYMCRLMGVELFDVECVKSRVKTDVLSTIVCDDCMK